MVETCNFEECDRTGTKKGLCHTHYMQQRAGKVLTPVRTYNPIANGQKKCPTCEQTKPVDEFYSRSAKDSRPMSTCKECMRISARVRQAELRRMASEYRAQQENKKDVAPSATQ